MAIKQTSRYCRTCGKPTLHQKEIFSGAWGCLLTLLTGGLFLIVWILADVLGILRPYKCQVCGQAHRTVFGTIIGVIFLAVLLIVLIVLLAGLSASCTGK